MFGRHFTHIRRRNETRSDEVMLDLGDVGQMFGLKVDGMPLTIKLSLTLPVDQNPNDCRVIELRIEPIKGLRGNWVKVIILVDRLHVEVYQHSAHSNLFQNVGGKIGVKFSYHTRGSGVRRLP